MDSPLGDVTNACIRDSHYFETRGRAAEIARGRGSWTLLGGHFFLEMLHDPTWHGMASATRSRPRRC